MNKEIIEEFLRNKHAETYEGLDDDMTDSYNNWLVELQVDDLIGFANEALTKEKKALLEGLRMEENKGFYKEDSICPKCRCVWGLTNLKICGECKIPIIPILEDSEIVGFNQAVQEQNKKIDKIIGDL